MAKGFITFDVLKRQVIYKFCRLQIQKYISYIFKEGNIILSKPLFCHLTFRLIEKSTFMAHCSICVKVQKVGYF
jgi:hypothetical protein